MKEHGVHGLIQHSFALRIPPSKPRPQYTRTDFSDPMALLAGLFAIPSTRRTSGFRLTEAGMEMQRGSGTGTPGDYSLLVSNGQTAIKPRPLPLVEPRHTPLPEVLSWAGGGCGKGSKEGPWDGFVFAGGENPDQGRGNDFLVVPCDPALADPEADAVAQLLCQLLAHRRSRLFGLSLARGTYNVFLPHALLRSTGDSGDWLIQPALSLFRPRGEHGFRPIFSLTTFMVPFAFACERCRDADAGCGHADPRMSERSISSQEIKAVTEGWSLASSRPRSKMSQFEVSGPLGVYLSELGPSVLKHLNVTASRDRWSCRHGKGGEETSSLTLRDFTEALHFGLSLRMVQGKGAPVSKHDREEIGDRVLTALSASRVSSVVLVADNCVKHGKAPAKSKAAECPPIEPPKLLERVSKEISDPVEIRPGKYYRLDQPSFDRSNYAIGVLPARRCVVVVFDRCSQRWSQESALLEAGWISYMVSGAATATGMIRSSYREIERADLKRPNAIAELEHEVVVDLHETYDLDITSEAYRSRYRRLRKRLGIAEEYEALEKRLQAISRETITRSEGKTQSWLILLSVLIVLGTVLLVIIDLLR